MAAIPRLPLGRYCSVGCLQRSAIRRGQLAVGRASTPGPDILSEVLQEVGSKSITCLPELIEAARGGDWVVSLLEQAARLSVNDAILALVPFLLVTALSEAIVSTEVKMESPSLMTRLLQSGLFLPIRRFLPYMFLTKFCTICTCTLHIALKKVQPVILGYKSMGVPSYIAAQLFQGAFDTIWILLYVKMANELKDILLTEFSNRALEAVGKRNGEVFSLNRYAESAKGVSSVLVWGVGLFYIFTKAWGFNVIPIWTSLGGASLIVGLAAQPLLSNIVSGLAIYSSRTIVPGDHILAEALPSMGLWRL
jgi:small-conductance mechanosensitive channel